MRKILFIALLMLIASSAFSTVYYIKTGGNDANTGLSDAQAWSFAKLTTFIPVVGDQILFKKGDIFYGSLTVPSNGTSGNKIVYGAYGTGENPIITGFTDVTAWTDLGSNIWESTSAVSTLATCNMVAINGVNIPMGRYANNDQPNGGFLVFDAHNVEKTSLTSAALEGGNDWTGAEVVIRSATTFERRIITSQVGNTLNWTEPTGLSLVDGHGFFIQADARTLDQQNEWYYNPTTKKIKIYSVGQPTNVKVASIDDLCYYNKSYLTFENITWTGANLCALRGNGGSYKNYNTIQNCRFEFCGDRAIGTPKCHYLLVDNNTIKNCNTSAIDAGYATNMTVSNNIIENIGLYPGMDADGINTSERGGINYAIASSTCSDVLIEYNRIINVGFNGIVFYGDRITMKNNFVNTFCQILDDGAAIYTYTGTTRPIMNNCVIDGNILINGIGAPNGTSGTFPRIASGVYLDFNSQNVEIKNNFITKTRWTGVRTSASKYVNFHHNTIYDTDFACLRINSANSGSNTSPYASVGFTVNNNKLIAKAGQWTIWLQSWINNLLLVGTFDNNFYARPIDDTNSLNIDQPNSVPKEKTLGEWQAFSASFGYNNDVNSHVSPKAITDSTDIAYYYNDSKVDSVINIPNRSIDVEGIAYQGNVTLAPFTSLVLLLDDSSTTYYVKSDGNDSANGLTDATAWQTIIKVNATTFTVGSQILFKRGGTYSGTITADNSGASESPITFGAYGVGANPIINGFQTVTGWTNLGSNIWESTSTVSSLPTCNIVTINGVNTAMGRYPNNDAANGGYLTFQSHSGYTSITSSSLSGTPNWTGAEAVIFTGHYLHNSPIITSQSSGTLNYSAIAPFEPQDGFGFFIQNDARTLDKQNEWYFNPTTDKLRIYSTTQPVNVKIASVDRLFQVQGDYITIDGLTFEGANIAAIWGEVNNPHFDHIIVKNCHILNSGISAVNMPYVDYVTYENNTITESNSSAIISNNTIGTVIRNNTLENIGYIPGMRNTEAFYGSNNAICADVVDSLTIEYNTIKNTGYNGINFYGSNVLVKNNFIDRFCTILDDGGAIYTYTGTRTAMTNVVITGNITINGIGAVYGTVTGIPITSCGIYLDERSKNVEVSYNSVADVIDSGILLNTSAGNINVHHNTVYNSSKFQYNSTYWGNEDPVLPPTGNIVKHNIFVAKIKTGIYDYSNMNYDNQKCLNFFFTRLGGVTANDLMLASTTLDSNYYTRPIADDKIIRYNDNDWNSGFRTLAEWQAYSGQDLHTKKSPYSVASTNEMLFIYNETAIPKTIPLAFVYRDVEQALYKGSVTLQPYEAKVLFKNKYKIQTGLPKVNGKWQVM